MMSEAPWYYDLAWYYWLWFTMPAWPYILLAPLWFFDDLLRVDGPMPEPPEPDIHRVRTPHATP